MFDLDICLCSGDCCPLKDLCLRFNYHKKVLESGEDNYNTYFEEVPFTFLKNKCDYFIEDYNKDENSNYFSQL